MSDLIPQDARPLASSTSKLSLTIPGLTSTPIPHATATPPLDPTSSCTYTTSRGKEGVLDYKRGIKGGNSSKPGVLKTPPSKD
ncbi:MAG: hypothetical protein Q9204_001051 [Flavoplaca sp. TL-2023a]